MLDSIDVADTFVLSHLSISIHIAHAMMVLLKIILDEHLLVR